MLPKRHRLRRNADIRRVYRQGKRRHHPLLKLYAARVAGPEPASAQPSRFAVSISRRVGNAVVRNRSKRLVREALRAHMPAIEPGWDCLFVARSRLAGATYAEVEAAVRQLLGQAKILTPGAGPTQVSTGK
jgi:ribonuclease P protein component